jgi:hypothetical protein
VAYPSPDPAPFKFGRGLGCGFLNTTCGGSDYPYCAPGAPVSCTFDRSAVYILSPHLSSLPSISSIRLNLSPRFSLLSPSSSLLFSSLYLSLSVSLSLTSCTFDC